MYNTEKINRAKKLFRKVRMTPEQLKEFKALATELGLTIEDVQRWNRQKTL